MNYITKKFPKSRLATLDIGKIGRRKHHVTGLLEVDVTHARTEIRRQIRCGRSISFYSWIVKEIGMSIAGHRHIQSINGRNRTQFIFDDVDISVPVERTVDGQKVPLITLVRQVNQKSIDEIHRELQGSGPQPVFDEKDYVQSEHKYKKYNQLFFNLPQWLRMIAWRWILRNPFEVKGSIGTAIITNIGMSGDNPGWIIPKAIHNLCFGIGTICRKPRVCGNEIKIRTVLHLTVLFDHDAVDGVPAAMFTSELVKNLESARTLESG